MEKSEHEALQLQGARARAAKQTFMANPYLKAESMPSATGEALHVWQQKHDAWHLGWTAEDAMRSGFSV